MVRQMNSKAFGDWTKLSNIHRLVDKTMTMCESYLIKSYLKISRTSSCWCITIAGASAITKRALPGFQGRIWLFGKCNWEWGISVHVKMQASISRPWIQTKYLLVLIWVPYPRTHTMPIWLNLLYYHIYDKIKLFINLYRSYIKS